MTEQFYDIYNLKKGYFILRAPYKVAALIYSWGHLAEARIRDNGCNSTDMFGNGRYESVRLVPVMSDWQPDSMPPKTGN